MTDINGFTTKSKSNILYANVSSVVRPENKAAIDKAEASECIEVELPSEIQEMAFEEISGEESGSDDSDDEYLP